MNSNILISTLVALGLATVGLTTAVASESASNKETERQVKRDQRFAEIDLNNDGYISEQEFVASAVERAEQRARLMFSRLDEHNKGEISAEEFAAQLDKRGEHKAERRQAMRERAKELRAEGRSLREHKHDGRRHSRSSEHGEH
ncbi:hypothetical protein CWE09_09100 [Aliidiomarina minuta]|uniref:EF-hand domain-containing protein n=1 Tax=Aliidiomarina minuta TaxID=880057 RepID=A0A432W9Q0_9GAMM|nr:EF-hand domain-containing protein [Aliidiomarina minuta]RUO26829.1 hypothetical protein CWE09_09100 [Aliidiomarina minuta]